MSLKEKLAMSGRALKKRYNIQQRLPSPDGATVSVFLTLFNVFMCYMYCKIYVHATCDSRFH